MKKPGRHGARRDGPTAAGDRRVKAPRLDEVLLIRNLPNYLYFDTRTLVASRVIRQVVADRRAYGAHDRGVTEKKQGASRVAPISDARSRSPSRDISDPDRAYSAVPADTNRAARASAHATCARQSEALFGKEAFATLTMSWRALVEIKLAVDDALGLPA
jgi:hypothetical protein